MLMMLLSATVVLFVPQVLFLAPLFDAIPRILRERSSGDLPLLPYSAMALNGFVWVAYGIVGHAPVIHDYVNDNAIDTRH